MDTINVSTKEELEKAVKNKYNEIIIVGKLANELHKTKKIAYLGAGTLAALTALLATMPFTGGLSAFGAIPLAALTGLEISAIIIAVSIGLALILAVYKGYDEISYKDGELKMKRKSS